jgi:hypothetical protein
MPEVLLRHPGSGRDRGRLERLAATAGAPVQFLGRVAMTISRRCTVPTCSPCRAPTVGRQNQEGFGIVFVKPRRPEYRRLRDIVGHHEAVADGVTGLVVTNPTTSRVTGALRHLLVDEHRRLEMGRAARSGR